MGNLLFINPAATSFYTLSAPLGLSYLANEINNIEVYGIDINVYKYIHNMSDQAIYKVIKKIIESYNIKYVGITILEETLHDATNIAEICKECGCIMLSGGIFPTLFPEQMPKVFDYLLRGDSEKELAQLIESLETNQNISNIKAISYQVDNHWFNQGNAISPNCKNYSIPKREIFDLFNFGYQYTTARMITSRGCIYNCRFCTNIKVMSNFCRRNVDDIVNEINYLIKYCNIEQIIFSDDQFLGTNINEYYSAFDVIKKIKYLLLNYNVRLNFQVRADHLLNINKMLPEFMDELQNISNLFVDKNKDAHIEVYGRALKGIGIDIGIESFSDKTLKYFHKGTTKKMNIECLEILSNIGVDIGVYMILFHPNVTIEDIINDLECYYKYYLLKNHFDAKLIFSNLFKPLTAYKGTDIYKQLNKDNKLILDHYYSFEDLRVAAFYVFIQNELINLCTDKNLTLKDIYIYILNTAKKCKEIKIEKNSILKKVICDYDNTKLVKDIYSNYFLI